MNFLSALKRNKLSQDLIWSIGSFFVLAISGIFINGVLAFLRDSSTLGIFNLAYAVYILLSQLSVWGIHYSVLRYSAFYKECSVQRGAMLLTALTASAGLGCFFAGLTFLSEPLFSYFFHSQAVGSAIQYCAFGLCFFPMNKVLLAYLNGLREMKAFALLQGGRYLVVMMIVSFVALSDLPSSYMMLSFFGAEIITFLGSISTLFWKKLWGSLRLCPIWLGEHFSFGTKGLLGGMFAEVNSRADVLLIGFFLSERDVGIYSFAAMLVDGLYHALAMIRINFNPILVTAIRDNKWGQIHQLRQQAQKYILPVILVISFFIIIVFYILTTFLFPEKGLSSGLPILFILLVGLNIICVFVPFDNLMVISGHPTYQALQQFLIIASNIVSALILLPILGIIGVAIGTALSYLCGILMLIIFSRRLLGWRLIANAPAR